MVMSTIAKPFFAAFHFPRLALARKESSRRQRKRTTIDLIHASAHLRRDIGLTDDHVACKSR